MPVDSLVSTMSLLQPLLKMWKSLQNCFGFGSEQLLPEQLLLAFDRLTILVDDAKELLASDHLLLHLLFHGVHIITKCV